MRSYYKKKTSKVTFKTHRKHKGREEQKRGGQSALSLYSRRYFT